jgi:hypothetical protein
MRLALAFLLHSMAVAQIPSKATPKQAPLQTAYLTNPVSLSLETVGPSFKGHDVVAIVAELKRSPLGAPKSEFETTPEYEQRMQSLLGSRSRQYVFVLDQFSATPSYDADKMVMNVKVTAPFVTGLFDSEMHIVNNPTEDSMYLSSGLELRSTLRSTTHYIATNGFGVKVTVTRSTFDEFGVVISKDDALFGDIEPCCDRIGTRESVLAVDMDIPTAKAVKQYLRVALVCTLVNPTIYEGTDEYSATISDPRETRIKQQYLLVHPDELWVYDRRSGHIFGKYVAAYEPSGAKSSK